jgi:hypothetical protein
VSKSKAQTLRRIAKSKEKEARRLLRSNNPQDKQAARDLLIQVRNMRTLADIEDTQP